VKLDHQELAERFTRTLLAAGWTRYHGGRYTTAWARPDGTRATTAGVYRQLRLTETDAFHLSQYIGQKMARHADALQSPQA
jgi:hypothetical protein